MSTQGEHNDWVIKELKKLTSRVNHLFTHSKVPLVVPEVKPINLTPTKNKVLSAGVVMVNPNLVVPPAPPIVIPPKVVKQEIPT